MAQIKRNSAPMAGIHFQIDCAPVKFFSASNYLCDQTRANTAPAPLGQNIEFFQPPADSTVLKAKQATRICDTHHGTDFTTFSTTKRRSSAGVVIPCSLS